MTHTLNIKHHLTDEILAGYAAGQLTEAADLLVAAHLSMCDQCRAISESYDALGGALLESSAEASTKTAMSDGSFAATMALIQNGPAPEKPKKPVKRDLPSPVCDYIGGDLNDVRWSTVGMGVKQSKLVSSSKATARLLFIPAGVAVPHHGHHGQELTLVLKGAFTDETDHFGPGDVEIADEGLEHTPVADTSEDCICLAVTDASLKFKTILPRLIQPFIGI